MFVERNKMPNGIISNLAYSNTNNITYQVPLFFIAAEDGPDNELVSITSQNQFIQVYSNQIPYINESYIYAYRLSAYTPIYCYKLKDVNKTGANFTIALYTYANNLYLSPGYISGSLFFTTMQPLSYSTNNFIPIYSVSAFNTGVSYNGNLYYYNNNLIITYNNNNVDSITLANSYTGNYYSFSINMLYNNQVLYNVNVWNGVDYNYYSSLTINKSFFLQLLQDYISLSYNISITGAYYSFYYNNEFDEQSYINAISSITLDGLTFIKYIIQPSSTLLSASSLTYIDNILYMYTMQQNINNAGSLYYAYTSLTQPSINSNLVVLYNQLATVYFPELGIIKTVPIHYEALVNLIKYRLEQNNNSTTMLYFNDAKISLPETAPSFTQVMINGNISQFNRINGINIVTYTHEGYAQIIFRTTSNQNNALIFEYINADIVDLSNRVYRLLTYYKHQLNISAKLIKKEIAEIINIYHLSLLDSFDIYVNARTDLNLIQVVIQLQYKKIAETVYINLQI